MQKNSVFQAASFGDLLSNGKQKKPYDYFAEQHDKQADLLSCMKSKSNPIIVTVCCIIRKIHIWIDKLVHLTQVRCTVRCTVYYS